MFNGGKFIGRDADFKIYMGHNRGTRGDTWHTGLCVCLKRVVRCGKVEYICVYENYKISAVCFDYDYFRLWRAAGIGFAVSMEADSSGSRFDCLCAGGWFREFCSGFPPLAVARQSEEYDGRKRCRKSA